jgi:homoserine kinase
LTVVVAPPATSANLGPGFDCLGLALELRDRLEFTRAERDSVEVRGQGAGQVSTDPQQHLVLVAFRRAFAECGRPAPAVALTCDNVIPHGRGLGSSSAAIVAGLAAARALGAALPDDELLRLATALEGHPDNVAPALLGGLTVAWMQDGRGHAVRLDPVTVPITVLVPEQRLATETARTLLPASVPFADAVHALAHSALMVAALTSHPEQLLAATEDRLHQNHRRSAYPASWDLVRGLRESGVPAAISGAGPSVLAFAETDAPGGWRAHHLPIATAGVLTTPGGAPSPSV